MIETDDFVYVVRYYDTHDPQNTDFVLGVAPQESTLLK